MMNNMDNYKWVLYEQLEQLDEPSVFEDFETVPENDQNSNVENEFNLDAAWADESVEEELPERSPGTPDTVIHRDVSCQATKTNAVLKSISNAFASMDIRTTES